MKLDLIKQQAEWDAEADAQVREELHLEVARAAFGQKALEDFTILLLGVLLGLAILGMLR